MADTKRILRHIAELYAKPRANQDIDDAILEMEEKLGARFAEYDKAFQDKLTSDIIKAVDDYWRFKNDKTRPTLAQILTMENSDTTKKERQENDLESSRGTRRRVILCMRHLFQEFDLETVQVFYNGLIDHFEIKYPASEADLNELFAEL